MCSAFREESTEAVLLVDACNAVNSLNSKVALHNISFLCPALIGSDRADVPLHSY